jgi:hypothetical protein
MKWRLHLTWSLTLIGAMGLVAQTSGAPQVRTDGVYFASVGGTPDKPTYRYFRFYQDGVGLTVVTSGNLTQVAAWFNKSNDNVDQGKWKKDGESFEFKVGSEDNYTMYAGALSADAWVIGPTNPKPFKFDFAKVNFAPEIPATGPKIEPQAKSINDVSYDTAGRVTAVMLTLEIVAVDRDGGTLTYNCSVSAGVIKTEGNKCIWSRPIINGGAGHGAITVVVTNSKGAKATRVFPF